ncbi:LOW QUALITY PROTEIN: interaptin [Abrus precatorius]|uniref:LOW QUALITY PROTEIN: interaptin n=1 Tax=Abrus precatorius TaxID=3816 RepID=A0A8B8JWF3_ABRPR|nr:LOW QUALITY PROTEIN: interaptin [Abrus precatorius]
MEALYTKLYDKYTKLKTKKFSDLDDLNKEQEHKFINCLSAAEELIAHLKNESEELQGQVNDLRTELTSLRVAKDKQIADYQRLLMEESKKNEALSEEVEKLLKLRQEGTPHDLNNSGMIMNEDDQLKGNSDSSSMRMTRKRSRQNALEKEARFISCENDEGNSLERASTQNIFKEAASGKLLESCTRANDQSGIDLKESGRRNWLIQVLFEHALGMKLSTDYQTDKYASLHCINQAVTPSVYRGLANHQKRKQSYSTMFYLLARLKE